MKRLLFLLCVLGCAVTARAAPTEGDDTLKFYLSKSDVVVSGTIVAEPRGVIDEQGVVNYLCEFKVSETLKGDVPDKGAIMRVTLVRFEFDETDKHPLIKKGGECILFLKDFPAAKPSLKTADFWFGVQYPSAWMGRSLKRLSK